MITSNNIKLAAFIPLGVACVVLLTYAFPGNAAAGDRQLFYLIPALTMLMLMFIGWVRPLYAAVLLLVGAAGVAYFLLNSPMDYNQALALVLVISVPAAISSLLLFTASWAARRERAKIAADTARLRQRLTSNTHPR